jgi:hypothetical protein
MEILLTFLCCQRARDALFGKFDQIFNTKKVNARCAIAAANCQL